MTYFASVGRLFTSRLPSLYAPIRSSRRNSVSTSYPSDTDWSSRGLETAIKRGTAGRITL